MILLWVVFVYLQVIFLQVFIGCSLVMGIILVCSGWWFGKDNLSQGRFYWYVLILSGINQVVLGKICLILNNNQVVLGILLLS